MRGDRVEKQKVKGSCFQSLLLRLMQWSRSATEATNPRSPSKDKHRLPNGFRSPHMARADGSTTNLLPLQTLQRYHGGPNEERISFMEKHSTLATKNLGVTVEQVSIFLTSDHTVISFFESSAEDIETPIIPRLSTPDTILRRSSDASMLVQVNHSQPDKIDGDVDDQVRESSTRLSIWQFPLPLPIKMPSVISNLMCSQRLIYNIPPLYTYSRLKSLNLRVTYLLSSVLFQHYGITKANQSAAST